MQSITISPAQALLILASKYADDQEKLDNIKMLYASGPEDQEELTILDRMLSDEALAGYRISREPKIIDKDPSRRYFETYLAYHILVKGVPELNSEDLEYLFENLVGINSEAISEMKTRYPARTEKIAALKKHMLATISGAPSHEGQVGDHEYTDAIRRIKFGTTDYAEFSMEQKDKLVTLLRIAFVSVFNLNFVCLPINLYGRELFADENRGRRERYLTPEGDELGGEKIESHHLGLMKSTMPLPFYDDLARSSTPFDYLRPAEVFTFIPENAWPRINFSQLVHPFSSSISGTMLALLRNLKALSDDELLPFDSTLKLANFLTTFCAILIFNSGGHSWHEFLYPLSLPEVREAFDYISEFNEFNLRNLLMLKQEAFDTSFEAAIAYNQRWLNQKRYEQSLRRRQAYHPGFEYALILKSPQIKFATQVLLRFGIPLQQYYRLDLQTRMNIARAFRTLEEAGILTLSNCNEILRNPWEAIKTIGDFLCTMGLPECGTRELDLDAERCASPGPESLLERKSAPKI